MHQIVTTRLNNTVYHSLLCLNSNVIFTLLSDLGCYQPDVMYQIMSSWGGGLSFVVCSVSELAGLIQLSTGPIHTGCYPVIHCLLSSLFWFAIYGRYAWCRNRQEPYEGWIQQIKNHWSNCSRHNLQCKQKHGILVYPGVLQILTNICGNCKNYGSVDL